MDQYAETPIAAISTLLGDREFFGGIWSCNEPAGVWAPFAEARKRPLAHLR
jgi:hypothetical protein